MKTPKDVLIKGILSWTGPMLLPILMLYFNENLTFNILNLCVIYPLLLSVSARNANFWLTPQTLAYAGIITLLLSYAMITISKRAKNALRKPKDNRVLSATLYSTILTVFLFSIYLIGNFTMVYNTSNFSG